MTGVGGIYSEKAAESLQQQVGAKETFAQEETDANLPSGSGQIRIVGRLSLASAKEMQGKGKTDETTGVRGIEEIDPDVDEQHAKKHAQEYENDDPELKEKQNSLVNLRSEVLKMLEKEVVPGVSHDVISEKILAIVKKNFQNELLSEKAFNFLLASTAIYPKINEFIVAAKNKYLENDEVQRKLEFEKQVYGVAREVVDKGVTNLKPSSLRGFYFDMVHNQKDAMTIASELGKYGSYSELIKVMDYLLHNMGDDNKRTDAGPFLSVLLTRIRSIQGIISTYRVFMKGMPLIASLCRQMGIPLQVEVK